MRLFHYTIEANLKKILNDGFIRPTDEFVRIPSPTGKRIKSPTWLSSNEITEAAAIKPTSNSLGQISYLTVEQFHAKFTLCRIEVKPSSATLSFNRLVRAMGLPKLEADGIRQSAKKYSSGTEHWYGVIGKITNKHWIGIETYRDGIWIPVY